MQKIRTNPHTTIMILLALLLICCGVVGFVCTGQNDPAFAKQNVSKVFIEWQLPVGSIKYLAFSSCNKFVYASAADGALYAYTSSGVKSYSVREPEVDRIVVCPSGKYAMLYSHINPSAPKLTFLDSQGRVYWKMNVDGAVWCADASFSQDRTKFVVGTGKGYVYVIELAKSHKRYKRWRVPGAVVSINADSETQNITLGTWQDSAVLRATERGKRIWEHDSHSMCLQYVESLSASDRIIVRSVPNKCGSDGTLTVLDGEGNRIWQKTIDNMEKTRILTTSNGEYYCLGYNKPIEHKGKSIIERHSILLDASGRKIWDKGSLFLQADPMLVTRAGCVLLSDGKNGLFTMTPSGDMDPSIKLPAQIGRSIASGDGFRLLLHCTNGKLYMLRVSQ